MIHIDGGLTKFRVVLVYDENSTKVFVDIRYHILYHNYQILVEGNRSLMRGLGKKSHTYMGMVPLINDDVDAILQNEHDNEERI